MSELTHLGAQRLIHQGRLTTAEQAALRGHLRTCPTCREHAVMAGVIDKHLILEPSSTRPSPRFTAVYLESAARHSRRSQIMKPIYAVGGAAALALLMLAGWFIIRSNIQTMGLIEAPQLPAVSVSEPLVEPQPEVVEPPQAIDVAMLNEDLFAAVQAADALEVERLLEAGANPDAQDSQGNAVLALAARDGQLKIAQLLLNSGADVNSRGSFVFGREDTAISLAATYDHLQIVELLIAHGADVDLGDTEKGITALQSAAGFNNAEVVRLLLENGADANWHSDWNEGETPLHWAAWYGATEAAEALLDGGADVDFQNDEGTTPLMKAVADGTLNARGAIIPFLLEHGADPNIQDRFGNTALHAASTGASELIVPLLEAGAQIDLQNNLGETPLHRAAKAYDSPSVKTLIEQGASLEIKNNEGQTALDIAANEKIREMLREAGAG